MFLKTLLLFYAFANSVDCLKILGLFPHFGKSHHDVFNPLLSLLSKRGHEMTIVSHFPPKTVTKGWRQINMGDFAERQIEVVDLSVFDGGDGFERFTHVKDSLFIAEFGMHMCEVLTSLPEIHEMIQQNAKFDVILVEQFVSDCSLGVAHLLDAPIIQMQSHMIMPWTFERFDQPDNPAYIPNLFLGFSSRMKFIERLENTIFHLYYRALHKYYVLPADQEILQRNLNRTLPPLEEIAKNASALLANTHYMLNGVKPLMPAIVEVGGMHIKRKLDPLNPELEKFMNESTDGVILFSMGSMIKTTSFPRDKLNSIFHVFSKLKQRIIWKWEGEQLPEQPDNVFIMRWVPQLEILRHPKTVAFISHGGLLGTLESLYAGKPILFISVFGDQHTNAALAQENGLGVHLRFTDLTKENIEAAMIKLLSPKLRQSAKDLSDAWRDNPDPLVVAGDLVEHIARHGGHRRRSPTRNLSLLQTVLLDVFLFIFITISLLLFIVYKIVRFILRSVFKMQKLKQS